jgi:hypothetical protein
MHLFVLFLLFLLANPFAHQLAAVLAGLIKCQNWSPEITLNKNSFHKSICGFYFYFFVLQFSGFIQVVEYE